MIRLGRCFLADCLVYDPGGQFLRVWWTPVSRHWVSVSRNLVSDLRPIR